MQTNTSEKKHNYKIAILDDEQGIIDALAVVIKRIGYSSKGFTNPVKAIETIKNEHFDLLVLDYLMNKMNGNKVIEEIRKFNKEIYIIILTGNSEIIPPLETLKQLDIQGYCEKSDKFNQITLLIESGIKSVKQSRIIAETREFNKTTTEFFSNISHELKTPLNIIFSSMQLLKLYRNKDLNEFLDKNDEYYNIIKTNCNRLLRLINNLLDISKLDSGFIVPKMKNQDIINVIETITLSIVPYADSKNINVIFDTDTEEKIMAFDEEKFERIMFNLLSNAIKFTNTNGLITVNITDMIDYIRISVKDTGIGIPENKKNFIFERFRQVDKTLKRNHEGTGLGLSIAKYFVEIHGGKIELKSELNKGSEFIIMIPCTLVNSIENDKEIFNNDIYEKISIELSDIL